MMYVFVMCARVWECDGLAGVKWNSNSNMLDWLGVTVYVTQVTHITPQPESDV